MINEITDLLSNNIIACKTCGLPFTIYLQNESVYCLQCNIGLTAYKGHIAKIAFDIWPKKRIMFYGPTNDNQIVYRNNNIEITLPQFKIKLTPGEFDIRPIINKLNTILILT